MTNHEYITNSFKTLKERGVVHTQRDFANLIGTNEGNLSKALKGDEKYLTDNLITKVRNAMEGKTFVPESWVKEFPSLDPSKTPVETNEGETIPVIPIEAMAGSLGEFSASVQAYDCERIISPIKGADYAMKVSGDSMSPEYPSGSIILIKKINEKAFVEWGKVYVLDTDNGAVIKQIRKTANPNVVECVSLNPDHQPFEVETSYIKGWYRVLMVCSLK